MNHEVGMIKGQIVYPENTEITVNAYRDGEDEIYKTTTVFCNGWFFLAYMEEGYYDLVFEAEGYSGREEDVKVKVGTINYIGKIELEEVSEVSSITVTVNFSGQTPVTGNTLYVTSYYAGDNILKNDSDDVVDNNLDSRIETVMIDPMGTNPLTVTLNNKGDGYDSGRYAIRAHIDRDPTNGGEFNRSRDWDFVAFTEVTVTGEPASIDVNGPWGTYFQLTFSNDPTPPSGIDTKSIYLTVVNVGDGWGNYAYGEGVTRPATAPYFGFDCWASDTAPNTSVEPYSLYACIDMDDNWDTNPYPDNGDYVIEGEPLKISVLRGAPEYPAWSPIPHFPINWSIYSGN